MEDQRLSDEFSSETITDSDFFSSGEALIVSEIPKKVIILYSFHFLSVIWSYAGVRIRVGPPGARFSGCGRRARAGGDRVVPQRAEPGPG